jgi:sulfate adenylyltransferase large subunit
MNNRESLNIVVVGHVDHGKSTLIGRLLYDTNSISKGAIDKVKRISSEKGKSFEYAYLLDAFEEEQKQGITIDTTRLQFKTDKRDYVIIDAPGHVEFLKNMISGAASAEGAILMVDAEEGIKEQSKRHGYILSLLGIKKVYVAVNKMDLVGYSEERYKEIERDFNEFLNPLGVRPIEYIPISAYYGENITSKSDELGWYKGESIIEAIDSLEKEPEAEQKELRFPIQDVYKFDHRRIIAGRIESGSLSVGDEITIHPSGKQTKVKTIEYWQQSDRKDRVKAGESVGITVEDEFFYNRGDFITHRESSLSTGNRFRGNVFWLGREDLVPNKKYKLKLSTAEVECQVEQIIKAIDASTLEEVENPDEIKKNDVGEVIIKTKSEIGFDLFNELENTGRFVIVDDFDISGGGIILGKEETELEAESEIAHIWSVPKQDTDKLKEVESLISEAGRYPERILHDESVESLIEKLNHSIGSGNVPVVVI